MIVPAQIRAADRDRLLAHYAAVDSAIEAALAACRQHDRPEALRLAAAAGAETARLTDMLASLGLVLPKGPNLSLKVPR